MQLLLNGKTKKIGAPTIFSQKPERFDTEIFLQESINKSVLNILEIKKNLKESKNLKKDPSES